MGYKSSQTIAAISWKTLHTIMKKIYSPLENISKQNHCSAESIQTMAQTNTAELGNKSVMPNTINSMKY